MSIISTVKAVTLPPWLNLKFIAAWIGGLLFLSLLWSWNERGHDVQRLSDFQSGVISAVSSATQVPDKNGRTRLLKPGDIIPAINDLSSSYDSAKRTITTITYETTKAKRRADEADKNLAAQIAHFNSTYALASRRISFLENRAPVAPDKVCTTIESDTNSPWDGWKN